jgi:hypothetical protein
VQICISVFCATLLWLVFPSNMELSQQQKIPRLADGRPDLQGNWDYSSIIPLERPLTDRGNQLLASPAISLDRESSPDLSAEYTESAAPMVGSSRSEAWPEIKPSSNRGSLITSPDSGRIPTLTRQGQSRINGLRQAADTNLGVEARPLTERCLIGSNSGPPMIPGAIDNLVQVIQAGDHVIIHNQSVNSTRIIALRTARSSRYMRQRGGDSIGFWDGDTLVIETTNFVTPTAFAHSSDQLSLQEKFWLINASTLGYEFTVSDTSTWSEIWTARLEMRRTATPVREHACHEENDDLKQVMADSRRLELLEENDLDDES